jgi:hypothetical protein
MSLSPRFRPLALMLWCLLLPPSCAWAQDTTGDSTAPTTSENEAGVSDSAKKVQDSTTQTSPGISRGDTSGVVASAQHGDTTRPKADTIRFPAAADSNKSATAVQPVHVDSVLSAACSDPRAGTIAQDLLVVLFAPEAGSRERAAVARSVKGKLLSSPEPGVYYVRLRPGGGEAGLKAAADELSRMPDVRQVGSRSCPPSSADTTVSKSPNAQPSSRSSSPPY